MHLDNELAAPGMGGWCMGRCMVLVGWEWAWCICVGLPELVMPLKGGSYMEWILVLGIILK